MESWECSVCGHIYEGEVVPEKCPVCEAPGEKFIKVTTPAAEAEERKWRCTVCGYIHIGNTPPESCPV